MAKLYQKNVEVSVVIPTRNRSDLLHKCLASLERQECSPSALEIIIVNDGSTDLTSDIISDFKTKSKLPVTILQGKGCGPAAARNLGWQAASGKLVAFTDDDCIVSPAWTTELLKTCHNYPSAAGFGGPILRVHNTIIGKFIDDMGIMRHPGPDEDLDYLITANAAYLKAALEEVGGFEEAIQWPGGEDPELSFRIRESCGPLILAKEASVKHHHHDNLRPFYNMFWRHGRGAPYVQRTRPDAVQPPTLKRCIGRSLFHMQRKEISLGKRIVYSFLEFIKGIGYIRGYQSTKQMETLSNHNKSKPTGYKVPK